jgi:Amt family ammonium transporter
VTIISGAIAERSSFSGYLVYSVCVTSVVYPMGAHWAWHPKGWLHLNGFHDFAGSGVVHLAAGVAALVGRHSILP